MSRCVHIVDDDDSLRRSLKLLMYSVQLETATYASAREFLDRLPLAGGMQHCLLLDVRMPDMSGLELQADLVRRKVVIPTIILSAHGDVAMAVRAMQAGAVTFLEKPVDEQNLIDEVFQAFKAADEAMVVAAGAKGAATALSAYRNRLTDRQRAVFDLMVEGLPSKTIAYRLDVSSRTVEAHRGKIFKRLGITSLAQLLGELVKAPASPSGQK